MNDYIKRINNEYNGVSDLIVKKIKINVFKKVYVIFLESLCSQNKINDYILKRITSISKIKDMESVIPGSNLNRLNNYDEIEYYLYNGFTIIIDGNNIYAIETKADINRSVSTNENEPSIKGPKNSFIESYQVNLGLIKKRIKSSHLKVKNTNLGRISNTKIGLLYIDNICKDSLVDKVFNILKDIDVDIINDSEELSRYFEQKSVFPTFIATERPDRCASALTDGKVVIICDESPTALILPAFFVDFINPYSDAYSKNNNVNFSKMIRLLCFLLSIIIPSFYIAIINYNQETIPTNLIINFAIQRDGVPFPAIVECIIMLIICEILRESDLRFPTKYGSAISILGALVMGDAAVSAGLVSPIMIIIISFTYISSLVFSEQEIVNALRYFRFIFLIMSAFFGLYGLLLSFIYFIIHLCSIDNLGYSYSLPLSPFDKAYFKNTFFKMKNNKRSKYLSNNITREQE